MNIILSKANFVIGCLFLAFISPNWAQQFGGAESVAGINISGSPYLVFTVKTDAFHDFENRQIFFLVRKKWIRVRSYDEFGNNDNKDSKQIWCDISYEAVKDLLIYHNVKLDAEQYNREIRHGVKLGFAKLLDNEAPVGAVEQASTKFIFVSQELFKR
jgi:hypothetical protein